MWHTQGDTLEEAVANGEEALELYVEGLREDGRSLDAAAGSRSRATRELDRLLDDLPPGDSTAAIRTERDTR